jgi:hypothetical protein
MEGCKGIGNRSEREDLAKVLSKRASCIRHDVKACSTAQSGSQRFIDHHSSSKTDGMAMATQQVQTVYFGNWKLMAQLNRLLESYIACIVESRLQSY